MAATMALHIGAALRRLRDRTDLDAARNDNVPKATT
jgi:hypothetical protein